VAKAHKTRGKQQSAHVNVFTEISLKLKEHAKNELVDTNSPTALLLLMADVFGSAGKGEMK
jgi:hypothetical protein